MLHLMDNALVRAGIANLKTEDMRTVITNLSISIYEVPNEMKVIKIIFIAIMLLQACFLRGLNASNTSKEDMTEYLQNWTAVSKKITPVSYSLLLHLPILLAYNNPNNWALLC